MAKPVYINVRIQKLRYHQALLKFKPLAIFSYLANKLEYICDDYIEHILISHPITVTKENESYSILAGLRTYEIVKGKRNSEEKILCVLVEDLDQTQIYNKICSEIFCDKLFIYIRKVRQVAVFYEQILECKEISAAVKRCIKIKSKTHLARLLGSNYRTLFPSRKKGVKK